MNHFQQEEELKKAYDARIVRRLLTYAKPYWKLLLLSVLMLIIVTAANLARPYIIKIAIDDHIGALNTPMVAFEVGEAPVDKGIEFDGSVYVRETEIPEDFSNKQRHTIIKTNGDRYFLASGKIEEEGFEAVPAGEKYILRSEDSGRTYDAELLSSEQVKLFREQDVNGLMVLGLLFLSIAGSAFLFNFGQMYILHYASQRIIFDLRQQLFAHLQMLSLRFFDNNPVGRLVTRVTNDTEKVKDLFTNVVVNLFRDILMLTGIIVVMLNMDVKLALISFTAFPIIIVSAVVYRIKAREAYRQVRVKIARINASFQEYISGIRIIQAFNREKQKGEDFDNINSEHYRASMREVTAYAIFRPVMDIIYALILAMLIWFGGGDVVQGTLQFGVLYAFINYTEQFFRPINDLTEKYNIFQSAMAASERIFLLLDEDVEVKQADKPVEVSRIKGDICFENVWFAYNPGEWVLKDINLHVKPGETAAIVGATGAGKSSIINVIERFYDVQHGNIYIDGTDIRELDLKQMRSRIGLVLQDVFLFSGTIEGNIRLNDQNISSKKVRKAANYVNMRDYIENLPEKYDTEVKERGLTLSLGQRQLLAFARALVRDPDVVILDEATANVDTETEVSIQKVIKEITRQKTTIIIAHRLSTISHADKIIVLRKGVIVETGSHDELMRRKGTYYNLYRLQHQEKALDSFSR